MKPLTKRELTCLQWVAIGKTSWETGRILGLAERTVNFHIQNACRKLGVHGRQAAIIMALRTGMLAINEGSDTDTPLLTPLALGRHLDQADQAAA